jgi:protein-tyrosine-phosphatase
MAEGILKALLPERLQDKVRVVSAGILGLAASQASVNAVTVMEELGIDISGHLSQAITANLLKESHIVFAMAQEHIDFLHRIRPELTEGVFLLRTFDSQEEDLEESDVADPIGLDLNTYRVCRDLLVDEIVRILPRLIELIDRYYRTGK